MQFLFRSTPQANVIVKLCVLFFHILALEAIYCMAHEARVDRI